MSFVPFNPREKLQKLINEPVIIRLKWGQTEYRGILTSFDAYMNFQLKATEEFIDLKSTGTLGHVFIRCNNVLWIAGVDDTSKDKIMAG